MDYKEWFDKLCETHEREMKQAELRGYARGYRQGLESDVVPKPCNGPKYDDWRLGDFVMQITQEFCEMVDEYKAFRRGDAGAIDRFAYECTDLITATVSAMEQHRRAATVAAYGQPEQREKGRREAVQMSGKFQLYVAFVDGLPIGIGTLTSISNFCNVKRREIKKLIPQKWRHGGRPHKKPKAQIKKCGHVIEIRRLLDMSRECSKP